MDRYRLRTAFYRYLHGYAAAFRLIPSEIVPLEKLGLPPVVKSFTSKGSGLVLAVGPTGCGKSTIANILGRFYDASSGAVMIDGTDICEIEIASLRSLIGVVTQDTILFNESIAHNIAYGDKEIDMDRVVEAATRAQAHQFIMTGHPPSRIG